jgi:hypothetical protein
LKEVKQIISDKNSNLDLKGRKELLIKGLTILNKNVFMLLKLPRVNSLLFSFENLVYGGIQEIKVY